MQRLWTAPANAELHQQHQQQRAASSSSWRSGLLNIKSKVFNWIYGSGNKSTFQTLPSSQLGNQSIGNVVAPGNPGMCMTINYLGESDSSNHLTHCQQSRPLQNNYYEEDLYSDCQETEHFHDAEAKYALPLASTMAELCPSSFPPAKVEVQEPQADEVPQDTDLQGQDTINVPVQEWRELLEAKQKLESMTQPNQSSATPLMKKRCGLRKRRLAVSSRVIVKRNQKANSILTNKRTSTTRSVKVRKRQRTVKSHDCQLCTETFVPVCSKPYNLRRSGVSGHDKKDSNFGRHRRNGKKNKSTFTCQICGRKFGGKPYLLIHQRWNTTCRNMATVAT